VILSIDQNCHSLWDALPKLQALAHKQRRVRHFIEDIDAAFTAIGAAPDARSSDPAGKLRIARERFHSSGGSDWGAALFYSGFLGRLPLEIRRLEPMTGMKTSVLARRLGRSVDDLYDEFSPGDNWQLIGSSYAGPEHHRTIADLTVAETREFLIEMMDTARADVLERFPSRQSHERVEAWFADERKLLERLLERHAGGRLVELYKDWLARYLADAPNVELAFTSQLMACGTGGCGTPLMELFTRDYETAAGLYNQALAETDSMLRPLRTDQGELPFFASVEHQGRSARTGVYLSGGEIRLSRPDGPGWKLGPNAALPMAELAGAGVRALAGKAILLTIQVRLSPGGAPLALPYRGSIYMPASVRLAGKLAAAGLLPGRLEPVLRIRFRLLDRIRGLDTPIRLPDYLASAFGAEEVPAGRLGENCEALAAEAAARLDAFEDAGARERWQRRTYPELFRQMEELDGLRRGLAETDPKGPRIREVGRQVKALEQSVLERTLRRAWQDWQVSQVDYWDSRGAILPWCMALGGQAFYNQVVSQAELYEEP